jgi:8-oxo-dGTP pyrophosphatase MutT (NUDIX family)
MDRRTDNELWSIPGGGVGIGETIAETVVREVEEETSLECVVPPTITKRPQKPLSVRSGLLHPPLTRGVYPAASQTSPARPCSPVRTFSTGWTFSTGSSG